MKRLKRAVTLLVLAMAFVMAAGNIPAAASDFKLGYNTNASDNDYIFTTKATLESDRTSPNPAAIPDLKVCPHYLHGDFPLLH